MKQALQPQDLSKHSQAALQRARKNLSESSLSIQIRGNLLKKHQAPMQTQQRRRLWRIRIQIHQRIQSALRD
jgi:hypothetical protein